MGFAIGLGLVALAVGLGSFVSFQRYQAGTPNPGPWERNDYLLSVFALLGLACFAFVFCYSFFGDNETDWFLDAMGSISVLWFVQVPGYALLARRRPTSPRNASTRT